MLHHSLIEIARKSNVQNTASISDHIHIKELFVSHQTNSHEPAPQNNLPTRAVDFVLLLHPSIRIVISIAFALAFAFVCFSPHAYKPSFRPELLTASS